MGPTKRRRQEEEKKAAKRRRPSNARDEGAMGALLLPDDVLGTFFDMLQARELIGVVYACRRWSRYAQEQGAKLPAAAVKPRGGVRVSASHRLLFLVAKGAIGPRPGSACLPVVTVDQAGDGLGARVEICGYPFAVPGGWDAAITRAATEFRVRRGAMVASKAEVVGGEVVVTVAPAPAAPVVPSARHSAPHVLAFKDAVARATAAPRVPRIAGAWPETPGVQHSAWLGLYYVCLLRTKRNAQTTPLLALRMVVASDGGKAWAAVSSSDGLWQNGASSITPPNEPTLVFRTVSPTCAVLYHTRQDCVSVPSPRPRLGKTMVPCVVVWVSRLLGLRARALPNGLPHSVNVAWELPPFDASPDAALVRFAAAV